MIINEWDNLIVTDNVLTNLPISLLSSIPAGVNRMGPEDLLLISRPCEPSAMTDTGYMSYKVSLDSLSVWMYDTLDIDSLSGEIRDIRLSVDLLSKFYDMLCQIRDACPSVVVDHGNNYENGKFNPYVISAIYTSAGTIISDLGGYRFADAMSNIFDWKKFSQISAENGQFDNIHVTGLEVNNNINAINGVFTNLSATSRLSAANLTSTNITTPNLTATNGVFTNLSATSRLSAANLTSTYITTPNLTATNANITNLTVGGQPYQHLSVMTQTAYNAATKKVNYFYFTYPG